jgi:hypothetical protein
VVVDTLSQHINGKLQRMVRFELTFDKEIHAQSDKEGLDERDCV